MVLVSNTVYEVKNHVDSEKLLSRFAYIYLQLLEAGDRNNAYKIKQLYEKVHTKQFDVAFCGHFSAGKSSLINELFATDVLPTSPIPTSANIVKVRTGDSLVRVTFRDGRQLEFLPPYNLNEIKSLCLDGENIDLVEIHHPNDDMPQNISIIDTPGIDSTDDAHRLATESMLHLADVLFYVMDYNHVQSELNLNFCKMLTERGIKLYLVVNQIDKHREHELSFASFKQSVIDSFSHWNVQIEGIFYTSISETSNVHNDLPALKNMILQLYQDKDLVINVNAIHAAQHVIDDHVHLLIEEQMHEHSDENAICASLSLAEIEAVKYKYDQLLEEIEYLEHAPNLMEVSFQQELQKILFNSSLMPFDTRQLVQQFLETTQPKFKVGFIFSEKKTQEEKNRRLEVLVNDLKAKAAAQLDWHIKSALQQYMNDYQIKNDALLESIYHMDFEISSELLMRAVKKEAQVNSDYILNYAKEVGELIKQVFRKGALDKLCEIKNEFLSVNGGKLLNLKEKLSMLQVQINAIDKMTNIKNKNNMIKDELLNVLTSEVDIALLENARLQYEQNNTKPELATNVEKSLAINTAIFEVEPYTISSDKIEVVSEQHSEAPINLVDELSNMAGKLRNASNIVSDVTGFKEDVKGMLHKADRLEQNQFTIALFGAFSAGKSSFANALLGEGLLPTSPNPTTAAITKITAPNQRYKHGTILVKVKSKQEMSKDIMQSMKVFGIDIVNLEDALEQIKQVNSDQIHAKSKPHFSFLKAFEGGIEYYHELFDQVIESSISHLHSYVAEEKHAAFIDSIEIFYQLPLTEQGITIVDTPGADSIHSRHTGVAFEYIKNADALLYVTYYNHAFTQADEQFLSQLGRVKEAFELDKMFFIVNAIDLARSQEEITLVIKHIEKNLLVNGIRKPRIYPVSSKLALETKLGNKNNQDLSLDELLVTSGFPRFEQDFITFIHSELVKVATSAAKSDIERVVKKMKGYIALAKEGEHSRQDRLSKVKDLQKQVLLKTAQFDQQVYVKVLAQEINELFYYVKQRLNSRLQQAFKISFSPAVLRNDVQDIKQALRDALKEWLDALKVELLQEIRATSVRLSKFLTKQIRLISKNINDLINAIDPAIIVSDYELIEPETLIIQENDFEFDDQPHIHLLSMYKNQKQFFEQSGNQQLLEALLNDVQLPITNKLETVSNAFNEYLELCLLNGWNILQNHILDQVNQFYEGEIAALSVVIDIEIMEDKQRKLMQLI